MPAQVGSLPQRALRICLGAFLCLSIVVVVARTLIRINGRHRFSIDDILLIVAAACTCVGAGLAYTIIPYAYVDSERFATPDNDMPRLIQVLAITGAYFAMTWTATFAAKMSVLFFFKSIVERIPSYNQCVNVVIMFNLLVWAFCVCTLFIACPHFGESAVSKWLLYYAEAVGNVLILYSCSENCLPPDEARSLTAVIMVAILDILTDIASEHGRQLERIGLTELVLSIPMVILWKAQMNIRRKLGVGAFLMVNIWLILLWPIRLVLIKPGISRNLTWTLFFQFVEPNIAILVASFSAFRSLFVRHNSKSGERREPSGLFKRSPRSESLVEPDCETLSCRYNDDDFTDLSERGSIPDTSTTNEREINLHSINVLSPSRTV